MSTVNKWGSSCPVHAMSFKMVLCESVCWRIGVCSDDFPVNNLWHWWDKFENGTAPPWAIFLAGGKTEPIVAMPPSILKSGNLKINLDEREPVRNTFKGRMQNSPILDKAGRLRLKTGDTIGIVVDTGSRAGDGSITFFVNGIQVCNHSFVSCQSALRLWIRLGPASTLTPRSMRLSTSSRSRGRTGTPLFVSGAKKSRWVASAHSDDFRKCS